MSFSSDVKNEIATSEIGECCLKAQRYGLLLFGRSFTPSAISIMTELSAVAEKYASAILEITGKPPFSLVSKSKKVSISVKSADQRNALLKDFGHEGREVGLRINYANLSSDCCRAAFIGGVFLACGTITSPQKEYHLEFSIPYKNLSKDFLKIFDDYPSIVPKISTRNGVYIVYLKDSSMIEDLLALMGAGIASMELMNIKIEKGIRNHVNRRVNFENANMDRSLKAAYMQINAIKKIDKKLGLDSLDDELRQLAELRLENPEMSLNELGKELKMPLSRSAVNHRFLKLRKMAEKL